VYCFQESLPEVIITFEVAGAKVFPILTSETSSPSLPLCHTDQVNIDLGSAQIT
jgi:hypothetical protein